MPSSLKNLSFGAQFLLLACLLLGLSSAQQMAAGWSFLYGFPPYQTAHDLNDFGVHWSAGALALQGQAASAYDAKTMQAFFISQFGFPEGHTVWGYVYLPMTFLLTRVLALADYPLSATVFLLSSLVLFLLMTARWMGIAGLALILGFSGTWLCLNAGQLTFLIGSLLGFAFFLLDRRPVLAGVLIGLAVIKPQFGILLPVLLLVGGYYRSFIAAGFTVFGLVLLSLWLDGFSVWQAFWGVGLHTLAGHPENATMWPRFLTVFGLLAQAGYSIPLAMFGHWVSAALACVLTIVIWRQTTLAALRAASAVLATLLISPMFYDYDLPLGLIALVALLSLPRSFWRWPLVASWMVFYLLPYFSMSLMPFLIWLLLIQVGELARLSSLPAASVAKEPLDA